MWTMSSLSLYVSLSLSLTHRARFESYIRDIATFICLLHHCALHFVCECARNDCDSDHCEWAYMTMWPSSKKSSECTIFISNGREMGLLNQLRKQTNHNVKMAKCDAMVDSWTIFTSILECRDDCSLLISFSEPFSLSLFFLSFAQILWIQASNFHTNLEKERIKNDCDAL